MFRKLMVFLVLCLSGCTASPVTPSSLPAQLTMTMPRPQDTQTLSPVPTFTQGVKPATPTFPQTATRARPSPSLTPSLTLLPSEGPNFYSKITEIVRRDPDEFAPVIARSAAGVRYPVIGKYSDWLRIDLGNGQTGWMRFPDNFLSYFGGSIKQVPQISLTIPPTPTSTPICKPQHIPKGALKAAEQALVTYFRLLAEKRYALAVPYFSGEYYWLRYWNPDVDPLDSSYLFERGCESNGMVCLPVRRVVKTSVISPGIYEFVVEFANPDGSLYRFGGCSRETPLNRTRWTYRVVLDCHGQYLVQGLPSYGC
jgi:hypothetical protein